MPENKEIPSLQLLNSAFLDTETSGIVEIQSLKNRESTVSHRLKICGIYVVVVFGLCFWVFFVAVVVL